MDTTVGIKLLDGADPDQVVSEVHRVDVVLGRHPTDVDQVRVLTRINPDSIKVFVDQFKRFRIERCRFSGSARDFWSLFAGQRGTAGSLGCNRLAGSIGVNINNMKPVKQYSKENVNFVVFCRSSRPVENIFKLKATL